MLSNHIHQETLAGAPSRTSLWLSASMVQAAVAADPIVPEGVMPDPKQESAWPPRVVAAPPDVASVEWQQLWFATQRRRAWSSLVVIPAHAGASAVSTARGLAGVAEGHLRRRVTVIIPEEFCSLEELPTLMPALAEGELLERPEGAVKGRIPSDSIRMHTHHRERDDRTKTPTVIVALEPVVSNPLGIPVALAADAALLCVILGETPLASAKQTVALVGRERFIGCVVWHPSSGSI